MTQSTHQHNGREYVATGKEGVNRATGHAVREFSHCEKGREDRLWLDAHGKIYED